MKNGLLKLIWGASLTAMLSSCSQQHSEEDFRKFALSFRDCVYAKYEYQKTSSTENEKNYDKICEKFYEIRKSQKIKVKNIKKYFQDNGVYFVNYESDILGKPEYSCFAAEIVDNEIIKGAPVYFTRSETKYFPGINTFEHFLIGSPPFARKFNYTDDRHEIVIDLMPIEKKGKEIQGKWQQYEKNNEYFEKNDSRWKPEMQAAYNVLRNVPGQGRAKKYYEENRASTLAHEVSHLSDSEYSRVDKEVRAFLQELKKSPLVLGGLEDLSKRCEKDKLDMVHCKATGKVFEGFTSFPDISSKRDLYRQSRKQIAEKAAILEKRWFVNE